MRGWNLWITLEKIKLHNYYNEFVKKQAINMGSEIDEKYSFIMYQEALTIMPHIKKETKNILDIGCGMAAISLYLYHYLGEAKLYLLDKNKVEKKVSYNFEDKGAFYNSLNIAKILLTNNNVKENLINLIEAPENGNIPIGEGLVDLVVSTISWGFHYPVQTYIDSVYKILNKD